jgi:hypothetical protein
MENMRSSTETIIEALRILAGDIFSEDGIANLAIAEAADRMEELCAELLFQKQLAEKYVEAGKICAKIYMARNITLSEESMLSALAEIDKIYKTKNDGN